MAEAKPNQTSEEFFAVTATGRAGVQDMITKMGDEIWSVAPPAIQSQRETWFKRAFVALVNNDALKDVLSSRTGVFSVYKSLAKAAGMGLQIGGHVPQAHLVPFQGKAELIVSAEGYKHAAVNGPAPVLEGFEVRAVYDGEQFKIDFAGAQVIHNYDGKADRGKLLGVYGIMTRTDGRREVGYMTRGEIEAVRDAHSYTYKKGMTTPWKTDFDSMAMKTAAKRFLKPYAAESEGLAMLYQQDQEPAPEARSEAPEPKTRDVSERMAGRLDKAAAKLAPSAAAKQAAEEPEAEEIQAEVVPEDGGELF
jgi:recombination protein RecT